MVICPRSSRGFHCPMRLVPADTTPPPDSAESRGHVEQTLPRSTSTLKTPQRSSRSRRTRGEKKEQTCQLRFRHFWSRGARPQLGVCTDCADSDMDTHRDMGCHPAAHSVRRRPQDETTNHACWRNQTSSALHRIQRAESCRPGTAGLWVVIAAVDL